MTTCVAAICDAGRTIVIAADKLIGTGFIESPVGEKIYQLHANWKIMLAGDDIGKAYPIIDRSEEKLRRISAPTVRQVSDAVREAYKEEQAQEAEQAYLAGRGLTLQRFVDEGKQILTEADFIRIGSEIDAAQFPVDLLVVGFGGDGMAHMFVLCGGQEKGIVRTHKEFCAIGSGETNAAFIMNFREVKRNMPLRRALYHVLEAKYYGELAPGVGLETDLYVLRSGIPDIRIGDDSLEQKLVKITAQNEPRELTRAQIGIINRLPELEGIPLLKRLRLRSPHRAHGPADRRGRRHPAR